MAFFGIIPYPVRVSKKITSDEKLLYTDISANLNDKGYCIKRDKDFLELFGQDRLSKKCISERTISRWLNNLEKNDFITKIYNRHDNERRIYIKKYVPPFLDEDLPDTLSPEQRKFHDAFPDRKIDLEIIPSGIDMDLLIRKIKSKKFLREASNMSLKCCIENYSAIVSKNGYQSADKIERSFNRERDYTPEEIEALTHTNIDDIEI